MMFRRFFSAFLYKSICCGYSFELHRQVDAIQMGTYNKCLYKEVYKKYTDCKMKTTKLIDCALIGAYAVIRSHTVYKKYTDCKMKTPKLLDCALIGMCAVIRSLTVYFNQKFLISL